MRRLFVIVLVSAASALLLGATARPAGAAVAYPPWEEGHAGRPFTLVAPISPAVAVLGGDDQRLELARLTLDTLGPSAPLWADYPSGQRPDPRMAYPLDDGHLLVSGGKDVPYVKEVDAAGNVVWQYKNGTDGVLRKPFSAEPATFGGRRCVLISDRIACRVFAVTWDSSKRVVWQYGTTDAPGSGVNQLADPFCATQVPATAGRTSGDVLIADSNDNNRVIEVRADDYAAAAPDLGYTAASIVWQYGVTGRGGSDPGYLNQARSPQRLANGDTLIADAAGRRIIEVRTSDYDPSKPANGFTPGSIVWSYVDGVDGPLADPNTARAVESGPLAGTVVVTDSKAQRVVIIDRETKTTEETFDLSTYERPAYAGSTDSASPRDARVASDGSLWIADAGFGQILRLGNQGSGAVTSQWLGCGHTRVVKAFSRLKIEAPAQPAATTFALWYAVDGKSFRQLRISGDGRNAYFPKGTSGKTFAYRMVLSSANRWATPVLEGLTIHLTKASTGGSGGGGGGKPGGSGNSGGTGSYTYPSTAEGGAGTVGTGTGSGTTGTGTGSGGGGTAASGVGGGSTGSGSSTTTNPVQVPVQSTGAGDATNVQGYEVQGQEGVSGVPLRAAPGAQAPEPTRPGPAVPALALVVAGVFVAAAFLLPWPFVAAELRRLTGFDHTRPARILPFRPLGK